MEELRFLVRALRALAWAPIDARVATRFPASRNGLPKGISVPDNDTWKAALAMRYGLTLVTGNVRSHGYNGEHAYWEPFVGAIAWSHAVGEDYIGHAAFAKYQSVHRFCRPRAAAPVIARRWGSQASVC